MNLTPILGTLTNVTVDFEIAYLLSITAFEDPGIFGSAEVEADARGQVQLRAGSNATGSLLGNASRTLSVECGGSFLGTPCDNDAVSESVRVSSSGSLAYAPTAFFDAFGTAPKIRVNSTLSVRLRDGEEATGFIDLMPASGARFNVTVSYEYDATPISPVPLPAAAWALLAALGLLFGLSRRRRAA